MSEPNAGNPALNSCASSRAPDGPERSRGERTRSNEAFHRGKLRESLGLFRQKVAKVGPRRFDPPETAAESERGSGGHPNFAEIPTTNPTLGSPSVAQKGQNGPPVTAEKRRKKLKKTAPGADLTESPRRSARVPRESLRSIAALGPLVLAHDRVKRGDRVPAR